MVMVIEDRVVLLLAGCVSVSSGGVWRFLLMAKVCFYFVSIHRQVLFLGHNDKPQTDTVFFKVFC